MRSDDAVRWKHGRRFCDCFGLRDITDVATDVEVEAPADVRDFVAAHGGRLFVWISVHRGIGCPLCLLETSLEPPAGRDRRLPAGRRAGIRALPGGHGSASGRSRMEFALRRHRRVEAYWNGLAWIA